jgi:transposase
MCGIITRKKIMAIRETAKRFGISATTIQKWHKRIERKIERKCFTRKLDM